MINPRMATMLAFITTDAAVGDRRALRALLRGAVEKSFNRVDLDGDTSTNDSAVILAGGRSGVNPLERHRELFAEALEEVCVSLAKSIAGDMEGAVKLVAVTVTRASGDRQAEAAARTLAESPLVKTAIHGRDANWGRVMAALGRSGAVFSPERVAIALNGLPLVKRGVRNPAVSEERAHEALGKREIDLRVDLGEGRGSCTIWTGDLTADYIMINARYRS